MTTTNAQLAAVVVADNLAISDSDLTADSEHSKSDIAGTLAIANTMMNSAIVEATVKFWHHSTLTINVQQVVANHATNVFEEIVVIDLNNKEDAITTATANTMTSIAAMVTAGETSLCTSITHALATLMKKDNATKKPYLAAWKEILTQKVRNARMIVIATMMTSTAEKMANALQTKVFTTTLNVEMEKNQMMVPMETLEMVVIPEKVAQDETTINQID